MISIRPPAARRLTERRRKQPTIIFHFEDWRKEWVVPTSPKIMGEVGHAGVLTYSPNVNVPTLSLHKNAETRVGHPDPGVGHECPTHRSSGHFA